MSLNLAVQFNKASFKASDQNVKLPKIWTKSFKDHLYVTFVCLLSRSPTLTWLQKFDLNF